jgi:hypothetical protein
LKDLICKINLPQRRLAEIQTTRWVSNPLDQPTRRHPVSNPSDQRLVVSRQNGINFVSVSKSESEANKPSWNSHHDQEQTCQH